MASGYLKLFAVFFISFGAVVSPAISDEKTSIWRTIFQGIIGGGTAAATMFLKEPDFSNGKKNDSAKN